MKIEVLDEKNRIYCTINVATNRRRDVDRVASSIEFFYQLGYHVNKTPDLDTVIAQCSPTKRTMLKSLGL